MKTIEKILLIFVLLSVLAVFSGATHHIITLFLSFCTYFVIRQENKKNPEEDY